MGNPKIGTENPRVPGSIPGLGTSKIKDLRQIGASPFFMKGQFGTLLVRFYFWRTQKRAVSPCLLCSCRLQVHLFSRLCVACTEGDTSCDYYTREDAERLFGVSVSGPTNKATSLPAGKIWRYTFPCKGGHLRTHSSPIEYIRYCQRGDLRIGEGSNGSAEANPHIP
jgi:hypothetical protein